MHAGEPHPLGRSGVTTGPVSFGAAAIGNLGREVSDDAAKAAIDAAWGRGIRYFDTAPLYGLGLSERRLGSALRQRPRHEYAISTKVGRLIVDDDAPGERPTWGFAIDRPPRTIPDYSRDGALRSIEASLDRLGLDRLDIVYVHDPEDHLDEALVGAFRALGELRDQGVIRSFGAGANEVASLSVVMERTDADVVLSARRLTLLDQSAAGGLLRLAAERAVTVVAAGVFWGAAPAGPSDARRRIAAIESIAERHAVPIEAVTIQLPLRHPEVATVLVGMRDADEVQRDLDAASCTIPSALWDELDRVGLTVPPTASPASR